MYALLLLACSDSVEALAHVDGDIDGLTLGEFVDGFVVSSPGSDGTGFYFYLTTYRDPCGAMTGYYDELAAWMEAQPEDSYSEEWADQYDQVEADAAHWYPDESYDTLEVGFCCADSVLTTAYEVTDGEFEPSNLRMRLEVGTRWNVSIDAVLSAARGGAEVSALDPFAADGWGALEGHTASGDDIAGSITFAVELPACESFPIAHERFENALPKGP